ncbi:GTP cyclohydrolase I FolE, partial [Lachnotalea glycerini]
IADALMYHLMPKGAIVLIEAEHLCMTMRGIKKPGSKTITIVARGEFETNLELKNEFLQLVK